MRKFLPVAIAFVLVAVVLVRSRLSSPPPTPTPTPTPLPPPPAPETRLGAQPPPAFGLYPAQGSLLGVLCVTPPDAEDVFYASVAHEVARGAKVAFLKGEGLAAITWTPDGQGVGFVQYPWGIIVWRGNAQSVAALLRLPYPNVCEER